MAASRSTALKVFGSLAFAVLLTSCTLPFGKQPTVQKPPVPVATSSKASVRPATPAPKPVEVSIGSKGFEPAKLTVKKGAIVRWENKDKSMHQVAGDKVEFHLLSIKLNAGMAFLHTFTEPGTYTYHDELNPKLKGTVIVTK